MKNSIYLLLLTTLFPACKPDSDTRPEIIGRWRAIAWTVNGLPSERDAAGVEFKFNTDNTYLAAYGAQQEAGVFRIKGDKLYTTSNAAGKIEKMVQIARLDRDTMVLNMNRVGTPEALVLISYQ